MSICREWSLVKDADQLRQLRPLYCRSWSCDFCAPKRRRQLMAQAASGLPTRFITVTINPRVGLNAADRLLKLSNAWRLVIKRMRRLHPKAAIEYLAVVEATKAGEPHLHILFRGPYVPQRWLSAAFKELTDSPIVDIRRIRNTRQVVAYVAKYIAKAPAQFGTAKRYWCSRSYQLPRDDREEVETPLPGTWRVEQRSMLSILDEWFHSGWYARKDKGDRLIAWKLPGYWPNG